MLQRFDCGDRKSSQERVAVVEAGDDEHLDQELRCYPLEEGPDPADVVESESVGDGSESDHQYSQISSIFSQLPLTLFYKHTEIRTRGCWVCPLFLISVCQLA